MHAQSFDALTRHTLESAPATRRAAFLAFAAAGALGLAAPHSTGARNRKKQKRRKKTKKRNAKLAAQQCLNQVDECIAIAPAVCGDNQQCLDNAPRCCPFLAQCDITTLLTCMLANS